MPKNTLRKTEKLCLEKEIEELFSRGRGILIYPLRFVYMPDETTQQCNNPAKVLFTVSKKKHRRAIRRNLLKRRVREAFRKNKHTFYEQLEKNNQCLNLAIVYIADEILPLKTIELKLQIGLQKILLQQNQGLNRENQ